ADLSDRGLGDWPVGWVPGNCDRLDRRAGDQLWRESLYSKPGWNAGDAILRTGLADRKRDCIFGSGESHRRKLSGLTRRQTRSNPSAASRLIGLGLPARRLLERKPETIMKTRGNYGTSTGNRSRYRGSRCIGCSSPPPDRRSISPAL